MERVFSSPSASSVQLLPSTSRQREYSKRLQSHLWKSRSMLPSSVGRPSCHRRPDGRERLLQFPSFPGGAISIARERRNEPSPWSFSVPASVLPTPSRSLSSSSSGSSSPQLSSASSFPSRSRLQFSRVFASASPLRVLSTPSPLSSSCPFSLPCLSRQLSSSSRFFSSTAPASHGTDPPTSPDPIAASPSSSSPSSLGRKRSFFLSSLGTVLWRVLIPVCFPFAVYFVYWEYRRNRLFEEKLSALRSRFQGETPFYGKLWGYATDYFLESSLQDGDLIFLSKDSHSLPFFSAFSRGLLHFLLRYIIPAPSLLDEDKMREDASFKGSSKGGSAFSSAEQQGHHTGRGIESRIFPGWRGSRGGGRGEGGGLSIDEVGVVYVENGQRYVITLPWSASTSSSVLSSRKDSKRKSRGGLEKKKYADQIAESFAEGIWIRRLRCSKEVRDSIHQAISASLLQQESEERQRKRAEETANEREKDGEGDRKKAKGGGDPENRKERRGREEEEEEKGNTAHDLSADFSGCKVSQWKSFLVEINRRYSKETYREFRRAAMRIFLERRKRSALLLEKRLDSLLQNVETTTPGLVQLAQHRLSVQDDENRQQRESTGKVDGQGGNVDRVKEETAKPRASADREKKGGKENAKNDRDAISRDVVDGSRRDDQKEKVASHCGSSFSTDDEVSIVEDLLLCKEYAGREASRLDAILREVEEEERRSSSFPARKKNSSPSTKLSCAAFPVSVYQAAGLLPRTPDPGVWTPEDLLAIDLLLQPSGNLAHGEDRDSFASAPQSGGDTLDKKSMKVDFSSPLGSWEKDIPAGQREEQHYLSQADESQDVCLFRKRLARQSAVDVLTLSAQFTPILYVRGGAEEKGERDSQYRTNMPALIRQRERKKLL